MVARGSVQDGIFSFQVVLVSRCRADHWTVCRVGFVWRDHGLNIAGVGSSWPGE